MVRGLMVVLAFAATAQAQDVSKAAKRSNVTARQNDAQAAAPPASRPAPEPPSGPLSRRADSPDRGGTGSSVAGESPSGKRTDCSGVESFLRGDVPVVRTYLPPRPEPARTVKNGRDVAAYVAAIMRCDRLYIFQISNSSKSPWEIAHARLEGPNGETLHVNAFSFNPVVQGVWDINVVVAEAPPGVEVSKLKLNLTSKDGRAVQLEAGDIP